MCRPIICLPIPNAVTKSTLCILACNHHLHEVWTQIKTYRETSTHSDLLNRHQILKVCHSDFKEEEKSMIKPTEVLLSYLTSQRNLKFVSLLPTNSGSALFIINNNNKKDMPKSQKNICAEFCAKSQKCNNQVSKVFRN